LGALPDDITIETPDLTLDNTAISFSASGTTVYVHYTVSDDVSVSIANNGLANSSYATATLSRSNNTITITSGTLDFSSANVVVTVTNNRTSNTASISLSQTLPDMFADPTNLVQFETTMGNWWDSTNGSNNPSNAMKWGGDDLPYMINLYGGIYDISISTNTAINASNTLYSGVKCWVQPEGTSNTYVIVNREVSGIDGFYVHNVTNLQQPFVVQQLAGRPDLQQNLLQPSTPSTAVQTFDCVFYKNYLFNLRANGMQVYKVSQGGTVTFHGTNYEIVSNSSEFGTGGWGGYLLTPPDNSDYIIYGQGQTSSAQVMGVVPFNSSTGELGTPVLWSNKSQLGSSKFGPVDGTFATVGSTHYFYTRTWAYNGWKIYIHTWSSGTFTDTGSTMNVEVDGASSNDNYGGMLAKGNYLFIIAQTNVSDDYNLLVYDISSDPEAPTLVNKFPITTEPGTGFTDARMPIGLAFGGKHLFLMSNDLPTIAWKDA
jgi:hypothetical protein